ncbi:TetR/AcrR family transcriptional regulator [Salipaludibacillus aurantiacus]|uniref:DNA-binding transcriptional regulator, AcrR family n=1 Tax=Salipaludibacillus aurantiacus TaxID=1601833 RepID=A0A1H9WZ11_9BACI|nr:TetR/AcrR family transcriptional regulator [Salipaludibacillus aurantiacus]SES38897.1 DNA-binding transcriptional regulator, AcrR family [Salipaludibacillus aurantiacus]
MPRKGFNDTEAARIKEDLIHAGRERFGKLGLKKTSINDLTEAAGIAQGTFYKFFDSKELLYFKILKQEEEAVREMLFADFQSVTKMTPLQFARILSKALFLIEQMPVLTRVMRTEEFDLLTRKLPANLLTEYEEEDPLNFSSLFNHWQLQGQMDKSLSVDVMNGVIKLVFQLSLHHQDAGEEVFEESLTFIIDSVSEKMFKEGKGKK